MGNAAASPSSRRNRLGLGDLPAEIDRWVMELEGRPRGPARPRTQHPDTDEASPPQRGPQEPRRKDRRERAEKAERPEKAERTPGTMAADAPADVPAERLERPDSPEAATPQAEVAPRPRRGPERKGALDRLSREGMIITFPEEDERVALREVEWGYLHEGSIAPRGPLAGVAAVARELGAAPEEAAALDFVAAWHGAPMDGVGRGAHQVLGWGTFRLGGDELAEALRCWRDERPVTFKALVGRYGIEAPEGAGGRLSVLDRALACRVTGGEAERAVLADPRLVAVLARAARHPDAHRVQVRTLWTWLRGLRPNESSLSTSICAALLYVRLALGPQANELLNTPDSLVSGGRTADEIAWLNELAARLTRAGHARLVHDIERIRSTPELRALVAAWGELQGKEKE